MKINEITRADIKTRTTFSPIREIILFDDEKWNEFVRDDSSENLMAVQGVFSINEVFPDGFSEPFDRELRRFMSVLDTFRCTLSFLSDQIDDIDFHNIIYDFRITIQNFQMFLEIKSYYSAFIEFRKMLEGILWMDVISRTNKIPESVSKMNYQDELNKIDVKFGEAYSIFNNMFHYKTGTPFIHINRVYREDDKLKKMLEVIDDLSLDYENEIQKFLNYFESKSIKRYLVLVKKLEKARYNHNSIYYPISNSAPNTFLQCQEKFAILLNEFDDQKMSEFEEDYKKGILEWSSLTTKVPEFDYVDFAIHFLKIKYDTSFSKYSGVFTTPTMRMRALFKEGMRINSPKNDVHTKASHICVTLLKKEIKGGGNRVVAFLRSVMEDICFNAALGKSIAFPHTRILSDVIKVEFGISIKPMSPKFGHLLRDDRPVYKVEDSTPEQVYAHQENVKRLLEYLDIFHNVIENIN